MFAVIAPGNVLGNVMGAGTTGTIAVTSEGLMQDYKAGHLIGSTPRSMTIAQLMGAPIGAAALAVTYPALVKTYGIVGDHAGLAARGEDLRQGARQVDRESRLADPALATGDGHGVLDAGRRLRHAGGGSRGGRRAHRCR